MEPQRPKVDRAVLDFVKGYVFDPAGFVIRSDGVCRLNPEMARLVVAKVSTRKILNADRPVSTLNGDAWTVEVRGSLKAMLNATLLAGCGPGTTK